MNNTIGQIEMLKVRDTWPNEAYDFTPWLAKEENIELLGKAIGLELEVENIEVAVGPYSADILAKDIGTGKYVVIENQLEKTDHDHLGKAITYGSVLDASAIVWIATNFTEEHCRALSWLNDKTTDEISFFGVRLELWKIDNSRPAVHFNVISKPAGIIRQVAIVKASDNLTDVKKMQLEFWIAFREKLLAANVVSSAQTPRPQYWFDVALGRSHIFLSNIINTYDNHIGVRVYISNKIAEKALPLLQEQKEEIERELGIKLKWNPFPDNRDKVIASLYDVDLQDKNRWDEYINWMVEMVSKFRQVFIPRIKQLDLSD